MICLMSQRHEHTHSLHHEDMGDCKSAQLHYSEASKLANHGYLFRLATPIAQGYLYLAIAMLARSHSIKTHVV